MVFFHKISVKYATNADTRFQHSSLGVLCSCQNKLRSYRQFMDDVVWPYIIKQLWLSVLWKLYVICKSTVAYLC